jgi:Beta-propeller repeat
MPGGTASLPDFGVTNLASAGSNDAFVAKLAPNGTALWAHRFGGPRDDIARGVAVDVQGNIFVTGYFQGTNAIGGTNLVSASTTRDDIFLARFSAGGDLVWAQRTGGTNGDRGTAVAVDPGGHILLTGSFSNTVAFGWTNLVASNNADAFLARYTPEGEVTWAVKLPDRSQDSGLGVAVDSEGNTFVTGEFGRDYGAMRLAKYGPDAQLLWITNVGVSCCTGDYARGNAVAVDPAGNAYVAGYVSSSITIAGVSLSRGGFAAGFSKHGPALWARKIGKEPLSLAVDTATNVYLSGTFTNAFNFGSGIVSNVVSRGNDDVFLARLALRAPQWTDPPVSQIAPDGVPLTLFANAVGSGGVRYQWQFNGMNLPGATNSTLTLGNLAPSNAGYYSLILTNPLQTLTNSPIAISSWRFGWQASSALFEIGGPLGKPYRLEYRDFMAESNWTTLSDFSLSTNPTYLPDPTSAQATNRIYRLLQLP